MRVRALDVNGDWTFGKGQNDYLTGIPALAQNIKTRLSSFLNDCFFNLNFGIDWFNLLGSKNETGLNLAIASMLLNTQNVSGILELSINVDNNRVITIQYAVQTTLSANAVSDTFQYDLGT